MSGKRPFQGDERDEQAKRSTRSKTFAPDLPPPPTSSTHTVPTDKVKAYTIIDNVESLDVSQVFEAWLPHTEARYYLDLRELLVFEATADPDQIAIHKGWLEVGVTISENFNIANKWI